MAHNRHFLLLELDPSDPRFPGAAHEWAHEAQRDLARLIEATRQTIATSQALLATDSISKEAHMKNPKECRERAEHCIQMANEAFDIGAQTTMFETAKVWLQLADHLEHEGRPHKRPPQLAAS